MAVYARNLVETASLRLVAYLRVSTETQARGNASLPDQYAMMEDWAACHGHEVVAAIWDIESGEAVGARQGMLQSVRMCSQDVADGILFFNFDRFFRDVGWSEIIRKSLEKKGKQIFSVEESFDLNDIYGVFSYQVRMATAELQRKQIKRLLHDRRVKKTERGGWIGHRPPFGYKPMQGELVPDVDEQRCILYIRRLYKWTRLTLVAIADYINRQAQTDPRWAPKSAKPSMRARREGTFRKTRNSAKVSLRKDGTPRRPRSTNKALWRSATIYRIIAPIRLTDGLRNGRQINLGAKSDAHRAPAKRGVPNYRRLSQEA